MLLARIEKLNPVLNAIVELHPEAAVRQATVADDALGSGEIGPLHGVPITIKEAFDVSGMHTTWGNPASAGHVADSSAVVVQRLEEAGAIVVGKTNVPFMLGTSAKRPMTCMA